VERSNELRDVWLDICTAMDTGDIATLERHLSIADDARVIGTDPNEWWSGARIPAVFREQMDAMGGRMPMRAGDPEAFVEGSVGWVADQAAFALPDGEVPCRITSVLHRENGEWKLVQTHVSLGVPNEEMFTELPT
jgi:ketosteroid isomerase-like protein